MPAALPNRKNNVKLTPARTAKAQAAIKNFIPNLSWPPVTANDKAQMSAAVPKYLDEIAKTASTAAKSAGWPASTVPAAQLAAQTNEVGTSIPGIAKFLPAGDGNRLTEASYAALLQTLQDTTAMLQAAAQNPTALGAQSARDASLFQYYKNV